ncbi:sialate O-acetylesterase [Alistipes sp.]|uniref:sialate O-acetylesterase n=1 Tax=Alistipes sp. TaxID=1872444 RepID=UPI003AB682BE
MKRIFLLLACLAAVWSAAAKVELPEIIGSGMVLQQNAEARLWGWANPRAAVRIETSWGGKCTVESDAKGRWVAVVKTPAGSYEPQRITITSGERVTLDNVLVGEVWFAAGQSNMEMPLGGFNNCPVAGANEVIARAGARRGKLRYVKVPLTATYTPQERVAGKWNECTAETAPRFTATGYFFAAMLNDVLDVPVGIVDCTWGGTRVESWTNREILETYPDVDLSEEAIATMTDWLRPMVMYNAMLHPLAGYTIRGFLWYQGESNVNQYADYAVRLANMVSLWRGLWGQGDIPFYYVEIAPFSYNNNCAAYLREAQWKASEIIPNSGVICTNDLVEPYEATNIHPCNKRDVGQRLAYMALNKTYRYGNIACESPRYESMEVRDGKAYLTFTHAKDGFSRMEDIRGFEICGPDRIFHPADVAVDRRKLQLVVSSGKVAEPVAVRYGFRDFMPGNIANLRELPLVPFRTDDF